MMDVKNISVSWAIVVTASNCLYTGFKEMDDVFKMNHNFPEDMAKEKVRFAQF
jgi:hypothetical protein